MATPAYMFKLLRTPKPKGYHVSKATRAAVIARDGSLCFYCLIDLEERDVTMDHIVSKKRGGTGVASNLRVACGPCNSSKSANHDWPAPWICGRRPA